jgi:hypothetical protein
VGVRRPPRESLGLRRSRGRIGHRSQHESSHPTPARRRPRLSARVRFMFGLAQAHAVECRGGQTPNGGKGHRLLSAHGTTRSWPHSLTRDRLRRMSPCVSAVTGARCHSRRARADMTAVGRGHGVQDQPQTGHDVRRGRCGQEDVQLVKVPRCRAAIGRVWPQSYRVRWAALAACAREGRADGRSDALGPRLGGSEAPTRARCALPASRGGPSFALGDKDRPKDDEGEPDDNQDCPERELEVALVPGRHSAGSRPQERDGRLQSE